MMKHKEAVRSHAAEKYVAGELEPAAQHAFEEHFFCCPECAQEVRLEQTFAANARAVFRERPAPPFVPPSREGWFAWLRPRPVLSFWLAANGLLVLGFGLFLATGTREPPGPHLVPAYFAPGPTRGPDALPAHSIPSGVPAFLAHIPAPVRQYASYSYEILSAAGNRESAGAVSAVAAPDVELYLQVPIKKLRRGLHFLVVRGNPGNEVVSESKFRITKE
jgi:anti-sigma factor RsiW